MQKNGLAKSNATLKTTLGYLPVGVKNAICAYLSESGTGEDALSEIRLRLCGVCAAVVSGENVALDVEVSEAEIKETFARISCGAVFAHRDDICRGFISLPHGVRVGICGHAKYERGGVVGIREVTSLVFRIPSGECSFAHELYARWLMHPVGMLICSRAGEGKTTAIRALARLIGSGERPRRVVVVDERCEFDPAEYLGAHVDIMRGYHRTLGVDIAVRTMSAEVLIVDEISSLRDSRAMLGALGAGVTVIATVHAGSLEDAMRRGYVSELVLGGLFESACVIERRGRRFGYRLENTDAVIDKILHGKGDV